MFCQNITFSENRDFLETAFNLDISTSIEYSTTSNALDRSNPTTITGILYDGIPFLIDSTTVVRAITYSGVNQSNIETHICIFLDDVIQQPANIIAWPNTIYDLRTGGAQASHDYEMDPNIVNDLAYSDDIILGLLSIPMMSIVMLKDDFWAMYDGEAGFAESVEILYLDNVFPNEQFETKVEFYSHFRLKYSVKLDINNLINSNLLKTNPVAGNFATINFTETKFVLRGGNNPTNFIRSS